MDAEGVSSVFRRHPMVVVAGVLALISLPLSSSLGEAASHIDAEVLCILFCLMVAVAGLTGCGLFGATALSLVRSASDARKLVLVLILVPALASMFVTNDVALITFVPLAIVSLEGAGRRDLMIPVIILQTIAVNAGSALTPFGNPQNLFIFTHYSLKSVCESILAV